MAIIAKPAVVDVNAFVIASRRETRIFGMVRLQKKEAFSLRCQSRYEHHPEAHSPTSLRVL
jgi:hypothetical protein